MMCTCVHPSAQCACIFKCVHNCYKNNFDIAELVTQGYSLPNKAKSYSSEWKVLMLLFPCALLLCGHTSLHDGHGFNTARWKGRTLLGADSPIINVHDYEFMAGYILGWIASVIYFFALPPQIIKNVSDCTIFVSPVVSPKQCLTLLATNYAQK